MTEERSIFIDGNEYKILLSDETDSLQAAYVAGKAVIGIWNPNKPENSLSPAVYAVCSPGEADPPLLELAVRRRFCLPVIIGESRRLILREFTMADLPAIPKEAEAGKEDQIFSSPETLYAYIKNQYGFFGYGIWAVVRKEDGRLIGKAGVSQPIADSFGYQTPAFFICHRPCPLPESISASDSVLSAQQEHAGLELSYHIFRPFRQQGYGLEACKAILDYWDREFTTDLFLRIQPENTASIRLAKRLGFFMAAEESR